VRRLCYLCLCFAVFQPPPPREPVVRNLRSCFFQPLPREPIVWLLRDLCSCLAVFQPPPRKMVVCNLRLRFVQSLPREPVVRLLFGCHKEDALALADE
jgi:hypothetical protein